MKFSIEYTELSGEKRLIYRADEHSFDMIPWIPGIDFEIAINTLSLAVVDGKVVELDGFCGLRKDMKGDYQVPVHKTGLLKVSDPEKYMIESKAYGINKEDWPVMVNVDTGWVCIGDPEKQSEAVEFINNCVAVIDDDKHLVALWLKPETLPESLSK